MSTPPEASHVNPSDQDGAASVPSDTWTWREEVRAAGRAQDASSRMRLSMWALQHLVGYATVEATSYELAAVMGVADFHVEQLMGNLAELGFVTSRRSPFGLAWEPTPKGLAAVAPATADAELAVAS